MPRNYETKNADAAYNFIFLILLKILASKNLAYNSTT
jgi:hypothetical protein